VERLQVCLRLTFQGASGARVSARAAVEIDSVDSSRFDVKKVVGRFLDLGGEALSCGTCLKVRKMGASEACPMSTMDTLVVLTEDADRVVSFG
jgi:hypothetical protein